MSRRKRPQEQRFCLLCRAPFWTARIDRICCSLKCSIGYKNRRKAGTLDRYDHITGKTRPVDLTCEVCGAQFQSILSSTRFCSRRCGEIKRLGPISHRDRDSRNRSPRGYLMARMAAIRTSVKHGLRPNAKGPVTLTLDDLLALWERQRGRCALTRFKLTHIAGRGFVPTNASVDRIENDGPYSANNVRLVCRLANQMRFQLPDSEFLKWCRAITRTLSRKDSEESQASIQTQLTIL